MKRLITGILALIFPVLLSSQSGPFPVGGTFTFTLSTADSVITTSGIRSQGKIYTPDTLVANKGLRVENSILVKDTVVARDGVRANLVTAGSASVLSLQAGTGKAITLGASGMKVTAPDTLEGTKALRSNKIVSGSASDLTLGVATKGVVAITGSKIKNGSVQWSAAATDSLTGAVIGARTIPTASLPRTAIIPDSIRTPKIGAGSASVLSVNTSATLVTAKELSIGTTQWSQATGDSISGAVVAARTIPAISLPRTVIVPDSFRSEATTNKLKKQTQIGSPTIVKDEILAVNQYGAKTDDSYSAYFANVGTSSTASKNKYAGYFSSTGTWNGTTANNYGIYAVASGGTVNYAGYFSGPTYVNSGGVDTGLTLESTDANSYICMKDNTGTTYMGTIANVAYIDPTGSGQITVDGATGNVVIGPTITDTIRPSLSIIGDADTDGTDATSETFVISLTGNATPTAASWSFNSTQAAGGYNFDEKVNVATGKSINIGSVAITNGDSLAGAAVKSRTIVNTSLPRNIIVPDSLRTPIIAAGSASVLSIATSTTLTTAKKLKTGAVQWTAASTDSLAGAVIEKRSIVTNALNIDSGEANFATNTATGDTVTVTNGTTASIYTFAWTSDPGATIGSWYIERLAGSFHIHTGGAVVGNPTYMWSRIK